ncbi:hypothetical protein ACFS5N_13505 [Mucilaginibacter ximonensis]|uniref:Uncharacterized protein n=1 Tax=Mucilaginibacter ximonensis TaxID=538021 RepID=A0ABW5YDV8_9SPHI
MATVKADGVMLEYAMLMEVAMEMAVAAVAALVAKVSRTVIVVVGANKVATASGHANLINGRLSQKAASF